MNHGVVVEKVVRSAALLTLGLSCTLIGACSQGSASHYAAESVNQAATSSLSWKGLTWSVTSGGMAGVASGNPSNVSVDSNGYLHLRITKSGNTWTAAELFTTSPLGFGTYNWEIEGPVDRMDPNVVLGLFPYGPAAGIGADGTNELDQEFSFWGFPSGTNFGWTFYPASGNTIGENDFKFSLNGGTAVTSRMVWSSTSVVGSLLTGFQPVGSNTGLVKSWTYAPSNPTTNIPQKALPLGMNLWCFDKTPANGQNVEIVLRDFQYVPQGSTPPPPPPPSDGGTGAGPGGGSDAGAGGSTNIAATGTGYLWSKNTSPTSNANRVANAGVNDGNVNASTVVNVLGENGAAMWEGAGVIFSSAKTLTSAAFVNGTIDSYGNGYFESDAKLQFTTDGVSWVDSGWTISPTYPKSSAAGGKTYTFSGAARTGVLGARVVGQTGSGSWSWAIGELELIGH